MCGHTKAWSSIPCQVCKVCGSDLAKSPNTHREPIPHKWRTIYDQFTGKPAIEQCKRCGETRKFIKLERPKIVCLCGSTRFKDAFDEANYQETMAGKIVLSVGFYMHATGNKHGESIGSTLEQKVALDELHKRKIDLADEVFVLNVGGYIGESTQSELDYALAHGKFVRFLESGLTYNSEIEIDSAF